MISRRSVNIWQLFNRRWCAGLALFSYLTTITGFPLPAATFADGGSIRPCGCPVAGPEEVCCCVTGHAVSAEPEPEEPPPAPTRPCCAKRTPHPSASQAPDKIKVAAAPTKKPSNPGAGLRWVVGMSALRCQGQSTLWMTSGAVTVPPSPLRIDAAPLDLVGRLVNLESTACCRSIPPLDRPPRHL